MNGYGFTILIFILIGAVFLPDAIAVLRGTYDHDDDEEGGW